MKIIIQLSNSLDYMKRIKHKENDLIVLIIREEHSSIILKEAFNRVGQVNQDYIANKIHQSETIKVEIIGHSSTGGKQIQADKTEKYPGLHFICIDKIVAWIEQELLNDNIGRATISILSCQAARGTNKFPALAEQFFELFQKKPKKITARHGYVFIEQKVYSLGGFDTALKVLNNQAQREFISSPIWKRPLFSLIILINKIYKHTKETPLNEKVVYYEGENGKSIVLDKKLYDIYFIVKTKITAYPDQYPQDIQDLLNKKNLENFSQKDFLKITKYELQEINTEKTYKKLEIISNSINKIKKGVEISPTLSTFNQKKELHHLINIILNSLQLDNQKSSIILELLEQIQNFVEYRQSRNYSIEEFFDFVKYIQQVINQKNELIYQDFLMKINLFLSEMQSEKKINLDIQNRLGATRIDYKAPSYYKSIKQVTKIKNQDFSKKIAELLQKFDPKYIDIPLDFKRKKENYNLKFRIFYGVAIAVRVLSKIFQTVECGLFWT